MPKRNRELVLITKTDQNGQSVVEYEGSYYLWYIPEELKDVITIYPDEFDISFRNTVDNKTMIKIVFLQTQKCILKQEIELLE